MDEPSTVLIASSGGPEWSATRDVLAGRYGYRVLSGHSTAEVAERLTDAHIDLIVAEEGESGGSLQILSGLRTSHPEIADKGDNRWRFAARDSLCWPFGLASSGSTLAVADTGNNRVLLWEAAR